MCVVACRTRQVMRGLVQNNSNSRDKMDNDEPHDLREVTYKSDAISFHHGLAYKRDKFCKECRAIEWWSLMRQIEAHQEDRSSFPLYDKPRPFLQLTNCRELGHRIFSCLMEHPELKHDCSSFSVCTMTSYGKASSLVCLLERLWII